MKTIKKYEKDIKGLNEEIKLLFESKVKLQEIILDVENNTEIYYYEELLVNLQKSLSYIQESELTRYIDRSYLKSKMIDELQHEINEYKRIYEIKEN